MKIFLMIFLMINRLLIKCSLGEHKKTLTNLKLLNSNSQRPFFSLEKIDFNIKSYTSSM